MKAKFDLYSHHALLFRVGSLDDFVIPEYFAEDDLLVLEYDQLKIGQVKEIVQLSSRKPINNKFQILVIKFSYIFHEAQNALLKTLEEPPSSTKFIIVTLHDTELLPTILSRLQLDADYSVRNSCNVSVDKTNNHFRNFLEIPYKQRLSIIETITKEKNHEWISDFKKGLYQWLDSDNVKMNCDRFQKILTVSQYLLKRGSNNKMLLEFLAIYLPTKKPSGSSGDF